MKITKDYKGLTIAENDGYILKGDLISDEGIEIDIDDNLIVTGSIKARLGIKAKCGIIAGLNIEAGDGIRAGGTITAGWGIRAGGGIVAGCSIKSGWGITAGLNITAGDGIVAGWWIRAGTYIDCGKRIFAGISVYDSDDTCNKIILCVELRNGTIAYGDLAITEQEETDED